ncbi:MAG: F0F1 ATP synthase subunit B [Syntrophomonadaceae bacterium]|nr:F0F1 ATP synthase subunit B [Syntrophomonadaceae bacterium]
MKRNRKNALILILTVIMVMGFATFCMASGDAEVVSAVPAPDGATPDFGNWHVMGWSAVNFLILLALLYKFGFGPVNAMMEQRTNTIESSLKHAEEVRVEVDQLMKETQANLAESRKEAQEILARANKAAEETKTEIVNKAQEEVSVMKARALNEIEAATQQARLELKDASVSLAIMAAEKVLGRAITEEDQRQMVKNFVDEAGDLLC